MLLEQVDVSRAEQEGLSPSSVDCAYLSRFRRLTPREVRLLILTVQDGLSYRELSETLGVTRGNVATTMQAIRRKLAVPRMRRQRLRLLTPRRRRGLGGSPPRSAR